MFALWVNDANYGGSAEDRQVALGSAIIESPGHIVVYQSARVRTCGLASKIGSEWSY